MVKSDIMDPSLVLYLPLHQLDGNSFMSKDAYGRLCTVTGASWRPNGRYFDGLDDKISLASVNAGSMATELLWVKLDSLGNYILLGEDTNKNDYTLYYYVASDSIFYWAGSGSSYAHWDGIGMTTDWTHLAVVQDGQAVTLYIDGLSRGSGSVTGALETMKVDTIGAKPDVSSVLAGFIGEVMVYSRALTSLEIQNIYLATKRRYR